MDKSVLLKTAMLLSLCPQRHAESLVTTHRWHFLSKSSSHWYPHPYMWAGIPHSSQENTPCSLSPLERGVQRSQDQATAGGRGLGADVHRADGPTYSAERVPSYSLLWAACHVQSQEGEGVTHRVDGGAGSADQGDVSYRGAEDLPCATGGQFRAGTE